MNFQIINRKAKRTIICFLVIISLLLSLIFPSFTKAEDSQDKNNVYDDFSIQVDTTSCPEELIVKLGNDNLFCVQDTEQKLPDEKDIKYWEKEKEILKYQAGNFTTNINKFANTKKDRKNLKLDPPNCESLDDCLEKSPDKNYYYFRIIYPEKPHEYFDETYDTEIIKIGLNLDSDAKKKWKNIKPQLDCKRKEVRKNIKIALEDYRNSFKSVPNQDSRKTWKCDEKENKIKEVDIQQDEPQTALDAQISQVSQEFQKVLTVQISKNEKEKLNLSKQAVYTTGKTGKKPIFYIRTWNNRLSPSERAQRVSKKIDKIIKGQIDIQGLGIFEKSTENIENEGATNEKSKIIKIISDSKFLSEDDKKIIEVTDHDALFEGEDSAANLAQKYLIEINKLVDEHKSGTDNIEKRGYPVTFLKDRLFSINSGLGATKSGSTLYQTSHRASEISDRIKKFAQQNWFLKPNRLVAVYASGKKLCILPESLKAEDYEKFKRNSNFDEKNKTDCKVENLVRRSDLKIIYGDEITKKINRADWQLTNTPTKNSASLKRAGLPETIIFMELNDDNYEHLMDILFTELDHILHKEFKTKQELAIYFLNQIEDKVTTYTSRKRIWLIICIVLLLIVLQLIFRISSIIKKVFSDTRRILFEDVSVIFQDSHSYLSEKIAKIINILHPNKKTSYSISLKLFLLTVVIIFTLSNIPKINILTIYLQGILSRLLEDQKNLIFSYILTQIPLITFIFICAIILDKIVAQCFSILEKHAVKKGKKTLLQSNLVIFRILLVIFTFIFIAPHLPAAGTIYFKGISAFAVLAFTWSASSVISDFVSGIILIYLTSLKMGDWIEVGETIGEINEQNLFFHKIKTSKNCVKTIPNSFILNNCNTNLTTSCQEETKLILHIPVGLGYDLPRELVEITLIAAALKTENVVRDSPFNNNVPIIWLLLREINCMAGILFLRESLKDISDHAPFVLITNLGDFAVTYELNVYTEHPELITKIYSDLQKNIQDVCKLSDIEILSPNYSTLRLDTEETKLLKYKI